LPEIVTDIGSYAGIASVVGLAVLSALYFSQARDVKRLREWAGRAPERSEEGTPAVPGRIVAQPQQQQPGTAPPPVPVPTPAKPAAPRPGAATPGAATPAAAAAAAAAGAGAGTAQQNKPTATPVPAGATANAGAAPAASSAPAKPSTGPSDGAGAKEEDAKPGAKEEAAKPGAKEEAAKPGAESDSAKPVAQAAGTAAPSAPSPATPASPSGSSPSGSPPTIPAPPARPSQPPSGAPRQAPAATAAGSRGTPPTPPRPGVTSRHSPQETAILPPRPKSNGGLRTRYLIVVLVGLLVLGSAAAYGVIQLTHDDDGSTPASQESPSDGSQGNDSGKQKSKQGGAVKPANVTVAVLNGTTVPGLAATLSDEVGAAGFKVGTITNFSDQQLAESVVQYAPGHEAEARAVSRRLGIGQREPVNPSSQALAGDATVIVIAGADKAP
jgi:LytR cell envelope-related transcriptional attenuator